MSAYSRSLGVEQYLKARCTRAVRDTDCTSELDEVRGRDLRVSSDERLLLVDNLVRPEIRMEVRLDVLEQDERAISAGTNKPIRSIGYAHAKGTTNPTEALLREIPIASWKVRRMTSCASSPHTVPKRLSNKSVARGKKAQHCKMKCE